MQSHIRKVHADVAVTCHLLFWQNDRDLLHATAVTQGWNNYWNQSQLRKLTREKKIHPLFLQGLKPATFQSWVVWCCNHWAIPTPQSYMGRSETEGFSIPQKPKLTSFSFFPLFIQPGGQSAGERRAHSLWGDHSHLRGAAASDGPVAGGQRRGHLRDTTLDLSEWHHQPRHLVS